MIARDAFELLFIEAEWRAAVAPLLTQRSRLVVGDAFPDYQRTPAGLIGANLHLTERADGGDHLPLANWLVIASPREPRMLTPDFWREQLRPWNSQRLAVLLIGLEPRQTGWRGWVFESGASTPLAGFRIVGPGMIVVTDTLPAPRESKWSRTAPALGERTFAKVRQSSAAIIGASRLGSQVAHLLGGVGIARLVLVDPDRLEAHNIVAMTGVRAEDEDESKAVAVARGLVELRPDLAVTAVSYDLLDRRVALHGIDLIVTTVDRDAARLKAAHWAAEHRAVHLDIGTGVTQTGEGRLLAADVRLLLPLAGCIRCVGGLGDLDQAEYELRAPPRAAPRRPHEEWHARGRLGSLPPLNALAAATGVQLWLDLLNGDLRGSTWHRLLWRAGRGLEVAAGLVRAAGDCPLCRPREKRPA